MTWRVYYYTRKHWWHGRFLKNYMDATVEADTHAEALRLARREYAREAGYRLYVELIEPKEFME